MFMETSIKQKKYVNAAHNQMSKYLQNFFKVGTKVIIVDGSYMTQPNNERVMGVQFVVDGKHELLTVTRVNIPFKTSYGSRDVLGHHNNCEIKGADGSIYYCSHLNMVSYK